MLKDGMRHCDVCDREIARGETYVITKIEKGYIPRGVNIAETGFTADSLGNIPIDICVTCRTGMSLSGEEMVN